MRKISCFLLFVGFYFFALAQDSPNRELNNLRWGIEIRGSSIHANEMVEGSPFIHPEFLPAELFVKQEKQPVFSELRLNAYQNYFEFEGKKENYELRPDEIDSIFYNEETYVFRLVNIKNTTARVPLVVVKDFKNVDLYKRYYIRFIRAKKEQAYKDPQPSRYQLSDPEYYLSIHSANPVSLKNLGNLNKELPELKNDLKKFIKINKTKKSGEKGLIDLAGFIDSSIQ